LGNSTFSSDYLLTAAENTNEQD